MKLSTKFSPYYLFFLLSIVASMDMDHNDDSDGEYSPNNLLPKPTSRHEPPEPSEASNQVQPKAHEVKHHHGLPILETKLTQAERAYWEAYNTTTYFTIESPKKSALWIHCFTMFSTFFVVYPISLVLNNIRSNWYLPTLLLNLINVIVSLICLKIFSDSVPDLYPGNAYAKMSWILLFTLIAHFCLAVIYCASKWTTGDDIGDDGDLSCQPFIPLKEFGNDSRSDSDNDTVLDRVNEGGSSSPHTLTGLNTARENKYKDSIENHEPYLDNDSLDLEASQFNDGQYYNSPLPLRSHIFFLSRGHFLNKIFKSKLVQDLAVKSHAFIEILFRCFSYPILGFLFVYVTVGISVGNMLGQSNRIFNLLAHFIKGGVFVVLGVFSLARYCGALSKPGLAWNKVVIFKNQVNKRSIWYKLTPHGMITMEGYESFLIFFYGITNVFLEHLAAPGGVWVAKDLQHVSIAFMFIGGGLCGLVTEHILSEWRFNQVLLETNIDPAAAHAGSPGYSPNPFPVFTIFWTGILMSQHEQASQVSTMIHMQWGYLLSFGSFFRLLTFILLMLVPSKNMNPTRPFTELLTSFALICGGIIFMQSTEQVVEALEYRGLTSMFTLNVNVGIVALFMGWEMTLITWKRWLQNKKRR